MESIGCLIGFYRRMDRCYLSHSRSQCSDSQRHYCKTEQLNIKSAGTAYLPEELFSLNNFLKPKVLSTLAIGGFLVGFGVRYAGGYTSGHAISGLSNLQLVSLYAVIGFFIGGLLMNHFLLPYIL